MSYPNKKRLTGVVAGWGLTAQDPRQRTRTLKSLSVVCENPKICRNEMLVDFRGRKDAFCAHKNFNNGYGVCNV